MRMLRVTLATVLMGLGAVVISGAPASAQTEGAQFCDVFETLLGEDAQAQCEEQGGNQIPVDEVTTPTCEAVDQILTGFEEGGGEALAEPIRQVFTEGGVCVFAQQEPTTTTTSAPPTTQATTTTTAEPGRTLAATGAPLAATGLLGLGVAGIAVALRRLRLLS